MSISVERLKESRVKHGLSQRELARRCKIGDVLIYRYEAGVSVPSTKHLVTIAEQLGVSLDYLAGLSDDPRGQIGSNPLSSDENEMVETYRRDGWSGVIRLSAERLSK